jgi:mRNA interferase YafQ
MTTKMRRDIRRMKKRGENLGQLEKITDMLCAQTVLPPSNKDHALTGNWSGFRECHIENDWVLIYQIRQKVMVLAAIRTGTHADFGW